MDHPALSMEMMVKAMAYPAYINLNRLQMVLKG